MQRSKSAVLLTLPYIFAIQSFGQGTVHSVSPNQGMQGSKLELEITGIGTNFEQGSNTYLYGFFSQGSITSGSLYLENIKVKNDAKLTADLPIGYSSAPGSYDLNITTYNYGSWEWSTKESAFTVTENPNKPALSEIYPDKFNAGQTVEVSIAGENTHFRQASNSMDLWFEQGSSTVYVNSYTLLNDNQMKATVHFPGTADEGYYNLRTKNNIDDNLSLGNAVYVYADPTPPMLLSVTPNIISASTTAWLTLTAKNTSFKQSSYTSIYLQNEDDYISGYHADIIDNETIRFRVSPSYQEEGYYDLRVWHEFDGSMQLSDALFLQASATPVIASISSVSPNFSKAGASSWLNITGVNTNFTQSSESTFWLQGSSTLYFPKEVTITSNTQAKALFQFPTYAPQGQYSFYHDSPQTGKLEAQNYFTLLPADAPFILDLTPAALKVPQGALIEIRMQNTHFSQASNTSFLFTGNGQNLWPQEVEVINDTLVYAYFNFEKEHQGIFDLQINSDVDQLLPLYNALELSDFVNVPEVPSFEARVYPVPANDYVTIKLNNSELTPVMVEVYDPSLALVLTKQFRSEEVTVSTSGLSNGIYFFRINKSGTTQTLPVAVKH
ncbi:MAG: T9SS type A sorting domain-containing protein [Bacteroidales bacterium]|nr:T9SS type A sorting domain-containing protein [Bacteroidales bacterium]